MPLLSLLLIFVAVFLLFLLAIVWVQWKKHTQPIAQESDDTEALGRSLAADPPSLPPGRTVPQGGVVESPRNPIGSAAVGRAPGQRPSPHEGALSFKTQFAVAASPEPCGNGRPASGSIDGSAAATGRSAGVGRISFTDMGRQAAARALTEERLHSSVHEVTPSRRVEVGKSPRHERPADTAVHAPATRSKATLREPAKTMPDLLGKPGFWRFSALGWNEPPQPQQEITSHLRMVMATPYLRTALGICSDIQRDDAPQIDYESEIAESRSEIPDPPRVKSDNERLLVLALWWIMVPAAIIFAFYPSKSIEKRLKPAPPAEFFYRQQDWSAGRQAAEETLARAYWTCAVQSIQYQYAFNQDLPVEPPPEFNVVSVGGEGESLAINSTTRDRYWEKLREVWTTPDIWERSYVSNPSWASDLFTYFQQLLGKYTTSIRKAT